MELQKELVQEAEVVNPNLKDYNAILQFNQAIQMLAQAKHPFNIVLAKNVKILEDVIKVYNEKREAIINEYAIRDEQGEFVGAWIDDPDGKKDDAGNVIKVRVQNPQKINDIEWTDKEAVIKKITDLGTEKAEVVLAQVDVNKTFLDTKLNKEMSIYEYLDKNFEGSLLLYLNAFGLFKGLDI